LADDLIKRVFATVDGGDASGFSRFFTDNGRMTFGNGEPMTGRAAIEAGVGGFFGTIQGLHHEVVNEWVAGSDYITEAAVTYDRLDGRAVTVPVVSIWHVDHTGLIDDYRVFFDLAPVFA
jgi:ketosteroid isomerase-like protein